MVPGCSFLVPSPNPFQMFTETKRNRLTLKEIVQGWVGGVFGEGWVGLGQFWEKEKWADDGEGGEGKVWHKIFLFFRS